MESLSSIEFFVQAADTRSYSKAGRNLGVSASAVGKSICRLETHLGVRLFHRSTRSMTLTAEGSLFLERCRRILCELEAAELELSESQQAPSGKLRVSLPLVPALVMPALTGFMHRYPAIELEIDFSDRMVDVIEEGFDVVMRSGEPADSRLQSRPLGHFQLQLLATPKYLAQYGVPQQPADLLQHACLQHRFPHTGKLEAWPVQAVDSQVMASLPNTLVCNTSASLVDFVLADLGIACLPDFLVREAVADGRLVTVLDEHIAHQGSFRLLWPSSKHLAPRLRVFIDWMAQQVFPTQH